jgi:hypothetical protein
MPDLVSAADVVGQSLYAGTKPVPVYSSDLKTIKYTVQPGQYICTVWSWIEPVGGGLYWAFYRTDSDYNNFNASYVKQDGNLSLPALPDILAKIQAKKEAEDVASKGFFQVWIEKNGKYVIGAVVVAIALPSVIKSVQSATSKSVSGTDDKQAIMWFALLVTGGYLLRKKYKGSLIIPPLDKGEFVPDVIDSPIYIDTTLYPGLINPVMGKVSKRKTVPLTT